MESKFIKLTELARDVKKYLYDLINSIFLLVISILYLFSYESWHSAQAFCDEQDARLPVLNHRKDLELFDVNSSAFTIY